MSERGLATLWLRHGAQQPSGNKPPVSNFISLFLSASAQRFNYYNTEGQCKTLYIQKQTRWRDTKEWESLSVWIFDDQASSRDESHMLKDYLIYLLDQALHKIHIKVSREWWTSLHKTEYLLLSLKWKIIYPDLHAVDALMSGLILHLHLSQHIRHWQDAKCF